MIHTLKSQKTNTLADGLIETTSSMEEISIKNCAEKMINIVKSKTLSEVTPVENTGKNIQSFLEISPV